MDYHHSNWMKTFDPLKYEVPKRSRFYTSPDTKVNIHTYMHAFIHTYIHTYHNVTANSFFHPSIKTMNNNE